jgi:PAS domain S-box-containing protein
MPLLQIAPVMSSSIPTPGTGSETGTRLGARYDLLPIACLGLGEDGRIAEANQAAQTLLGVRAPLLVGEPFSKFVAPEHAERFERHRRELLERRTRCGCALELKAGEQRYEVRLESMWTSDTSGPRWLLCVLDDTEVNRLRRAAQRTQGLEALGTLTAGVAHDFGNLLNATLGCANAARTRLGPEHPAHGPIEQLCEVADRGRALIEQLLRLSRPNDPELEPNEAEPVELDGALGAAATLLRPLLGDDVEVALDLSAGDARIVIDRGELDHILLNLATNARHAMPSGGQLRLASRVLHPGAEAGCASGVPEPRVVLEVKDTGLGMDEATRARAFEPFFTTKRAGTGTGLGLAMVLGAVSKAGGHAELESAPGRGTTVSLYFPLAH